MSRDQEQETALFDDGVFFDEMQEPEQLPEATARQIARERRAQVHQGPRVTQVRLMAHIRRVSQFWLEVSLSLKLDDERGWMTIHDEDLPWLVSDTGAKTSASRSLYAISLFKELMEKEGVGVSLGQGEVRSTGPVEEWSWWAQLHARLSVAVQVRDDGSVRVVGLK